MPMRSFCPSCLDPNSQAMRMIRQVCSFTFWRAATALPGTLPPPVWVSALTAPALDFRLATGGGVDFRVAPRIAVRPIQIDWIHLGNTTLFGSDMGSSNGFRYSGGIVVRF